MNRNARRATAVVALTLAMLPVVTNSVGTTHGTPEPVAKVASAPVVVVHGSYAASRLWKQQGAADCVPSSVRVIVGVLTGHAPSLKSVDSVARRVAGLDANGTEFAKAPAIFAEYGVHAGYGATTLDNVRASLDAGKPVVADIDANPVWALSGLRGAGTGPAWHAVVVERIDDSAHTVTLVDSGWYGGVAETVPTAVFLTAWDASGNAVVMPAA